MSTELSRVSSHKRRKEEEKQKRAQKRKELVSVRMRSSRSGTAASSAAGTTAERTSRARRKSQKEPTKKPVEEDGPIPARTATYASKKIKISKYFINTLIILFVLLTAFLVWWGVKDAPPLEELW